MYFAENETLNKISNFDQNHGLTPLEKCEFCGCLKPMFWLFTRVVCYIKRPKIVNLRFILTIYDMAIEGVTRNYRRFQGVTRGDKGLQGVTMGYKGLQGLTRGNRGLQGVTGGDRGLQGVTGGYKGLQGVTGVYKELHGVTKDFRTFL